MLKTTLNSETKKLGFYKEQKWWYADLPEFLLKGLGTKADLLMVDGSDKFLDILSSNGTQVKIEMSTKPFQKQTIHLEKIKLGMNKELLDKAGHAPVNYGAYYQVVSFENKPFEHQLWLCPVAEYVFNGSYPQNIYLRVVN